MDRKPQIEAGSFTAPRNKLLMIAPEEIIVDPSSNFGRWESSHDEATIEARMKSFEAQGQITPVIIRQVTGSNKVHLVAGYCRHAAAMLYNRVHPTPMKLACMLQDMNEEEALLKNIEENEERKETTAMDKASAHRVLRDRLGWTDAQIAEKYRLSAGYVGQLKKLLLLSREIQKKVHLREISISDALALADLTPEEQKEVLDEKPDKPAPDEAGHSANAPQGTQEQEDPFADAPAPEPPGQTQAPADPQAASAPEPSPGPEPAAEPASAKPGGEPGKKPGKPEKPKSMKEKIREQKQKHNKKTPRSVSEIKDFFEGLTGPAESKPMQQMALLMLNFVNGLVSNPAMEKTLNELLNIKSESKSA